MSKLITSLNSFERTYSGLLKWLGRVFIAISLYAGTAYLDRNYVSKSYFDAAIVKITLERKEGVDEQKGQLKEISTKLDALLLRDSANGQRLADFERRLGKMEDKVDGLAKGN